MLINLDEIKDFSGGSLEIAELAERKAISYINSLLGYKIQDSEYIYESDTLPREIYVPQYPISSITKIEENTGTIFVPVFEEVDNTEYRAIGTAGKIICQRYIGRPVKITYRSGFLPYVAPVDPEIAGQEGNTPEDIKTAIILLSKYFFNSQKDVNIADIKSETVDGDKIEFNPPQDKIDIVNSLLSNYHKYDVFA